MSDKKVGDAAESDLEAQPFLRHDESNLANSRAHVVERGPSRCSCRCFLGVCIAVGIQLAVANYLLTYFLDVSLLYVWDTILHPNMLVGSL